MIIVDIKPLNNQQIIKSIEGVQYVITIKNADGIMVYSIEAEGELLVSNFRFSKTELMLPYSRLQINGNFYLTTLEGDSVNYLEFGTTQFLYFLSLEEVEAI
ncbi:conserved hypothetical protein [Vibrio chagasii]|nr:conserved hypothetical protein [Vibrio chagasii]